MSLSVSVIIPTLDAGDTLSACVASMAGPDADDIELILVDNGSHDDSVAQCREILSNTIVIRNDQNLGFAPACNQGARAATKQWLLFLNSDAELQPGAIGKLVASANSLGAAILQPMIEDASGAPDSAGDLFTRWGFMWHLANRPSGVRPIFSVKGACMLVDRRVFEELGGFRDPYFAYFEETDLCWRARMAGHKIFSDPSIAVRHIGGHTTSHIFKPQEIYYLSFRNRLRSILSNPSTLSLLAVLPLHLIGCLGTIVSFALKGRSDVAIGIAKGLLWPLTHLSEVRAQRQASQLQRRVPDSQVFSTDVSMKMTSSMALHLLSGTLSRWTGR